jgi:hypothetical protein
VLATHCSLISLRTLKIAITRTSLRQALEMEALASTQQRFKREYSLQHLRQLWSSNDIDVIVGILRWLGEEVHNTFNTTVPRLLSFPSDMQARMAIWIGWLVSNGSHRKLGGKVEELVQAVTTSLSFDDEAVCPLLAAIWRSMWQTLFPHSQWHHPMRAARDAGTSELGVNAPENGAISHGSRGVYCNCG